VSHRYPITDAAGSVQVPVEHFAAGFSFVAQLAANNAPDNNIHLHMFG
jgi:hypothetical protein